MHHVRCATPASTSIDATWGAIPINRSRQVEMQTATIAIPTPMLEWRGRAPTGAVALRGLYYSIRRNRNGGTDPPIR
jgi:hypothetical protein